MLIVFAWGHVAFFLPCTKISICFFVISCFQEEEVEHYTQQLEDLEQQVHVLVFTV